MSTRPKRDRRAPQRFGEYDEEAEQQDDPLPPPRARKRARHEYQPQQEQDAAGARADDAVMPPKDNGTVSAAAAAAAAAAATVTTAAPLAIAAVAGMTSSGGSGGSGGRRQRRVGHASAVSPADVLVTLHACPRLMDLVLEADSLRSISLLARDVASLAVTLCARCDDMAEVWRQLAISVDPTISYSSTTAQVMDAVQQAVHLDPVRYERCCQSTAKSEYRLSDKDLAPLLYETRRNPHYRSAAPMKLFSVLDCRIVAHRKYGDAEGVEAARQKALARHEKARETHQHNIARRREEMDACLAAEGLCSIRFRHAREAQLYVQHGLGNPTSIAHTLRVRDEQERGRSQRRQQLRQRLELEGLGSEMCRSPAAYCYVNTGQLRGANGGEDPGDGGVLTAVVAAVRQEARARQEREARFTRMNHLLAAEGLGGYAYLPAVQRFVAGSGTEQEALEAARQEHRERLSRAAASQQAAASALCHAAAAAMGHPLLPAPGAHPLKCARCRKNTPSPACTAHCCGRCCTEAACPRHHGPHH